MHWLWNHQGITLWVLFFFFVATFFVCLIVEERRTMARVRHEMQAESRRRHPSNR